MLFLDGHQNSDSMMVRFANYGASPLASKIFEHVDITSVLVLVDAMPDARDALSAWGAKFHANHCGYNRSEIVASR